jgi:uncharacterized protein (DUF1800 family)
MRLLDLFDKIDFPVIQSIDLNEKVGKLTNKEALHLLRRLSFHPSPEQVAMIAGKTAAEAFDLIIGSGTEPLPEPTSSMKNWIDKLEENPLDDLPLDIRFQIEGKQKNNYGEFIDWWLKLMKSTTFPEIEKLTLFLSSIWSIEFTYDTEALIPVPLLYRNNNTIRQLKLASYKSIASAITLDGAMLLYQSLFYSTNTAPNENYARELMELFTMGIGDLDTGNANYTEADIREISKAFTGWRTVAYLGQEGAPANKPFQTFFVSKFHDKGSKKIFQFGKIDPISDEENTEDLVKQKEIDGLIDILFNERGMSIARFIADKLIRFYCYSSPYSNIQLINELAQYFVENDFNLYKLYKKLFTSNFFFSNEIIGCQIKTPPEFLIGLQRMFGVDFDSSQTGKTRRYMNSLEQVLYDPPNVGSWKGYRTWINTTTYPLRVKYAREYLDMLTDNDLFKFIKKFKDYTDINLLTKNLVDYLLPFDVSTERIGEYKNILLNVIPENNWENSINSEDLKVADGIRMFFVRIFSTPDFQLC